MHFHRPDGSSRNAATEFPEELTALMDEEQFGELKMVASHPTIDLIRAAAAEEDEYQQLISQIARG